MKFRIEIERNTEHEIKRILLERYEQSILRFQDNVDDIDDAVHQLRKDMKKVRAALRLVRDTIGKNQYKKGNAKARDIARTAEKLRESYVMVGTMDKIKERFGNELDEQTFSVIVEKLNTHYYNLKHKLVDEENLPDHLLTNLYRAKKDLENLSFEDDDFSVFAHGLKRVYKRGRKAGKKARKEHSVKNHHEWRKRVKYLWYHIRMLRNCWPEGLKGYIRELHQLSDYLGDDHDLYDLREKIHSRSFFDDHNKVNVENLDTLIDNFSREKRESAWELGNKIYAEKPKEFVGRIKTYWETSLQGFKESEGKYNRR